MTELRALKILYAQQLQTNAVCRLPKIVGICRLSVPSFYFDRATLQCQSFLYGGCGGNGNRFNSLEECQSLCLPSGILSHGATILFLFNFIHLPFLHGAEALMLNEQLSLLRFLVLSRISAFKSIHILHIDI